MKRDGDLPNNSRAETDNSLRMERVAANKARLQAAADAERKLDALIARDRLLSDLRMTRVREFADDILAEDRSVSAEPSPAVIRERATADRSKDAERSAMDAVLEHERRRADEHQETRRESDAPTHEAERRSTDEHLSLERSEADAATVTASMMSLRALETAQRTEDDRAGGLAMVTHDLRSPLCVILGNAEMIAERTDDAFTREAADNIVNASGRMGRLLNDLLDLARIDAETFRLEKRPNAVAALLSEMLESYRPVFANLGVDLAGEVPPADLVANFDRDRVVQMLSNLLSNAMKFTPRGGHVELAGEQDADELLFSVRDDGEGIEESALPNLFERFWQGHPDARRGLGLGLYICSTIAKAHGGDISVQSKPGAGSTFQVRLPISGYSVYTLLTN